MIKFFNFPYKKPLYKFEIKLVGFRSELFVRTLPTVWKTQFNLSPLVSQLNIYEISVSLSPPCSNNSTHKFPHRDETLERNNRWQSHKESRTGDPKNKKSQTKVRLPNRRPQWARPGIYNSPADLGLIVCRAVRQPTDGNTQHWQRCWGGGCGQLLICR